MAGDGNPPPEARFKPVLFMCGEEGQRSVAKGHVEGAREGSERPAHWLIGSAKALLRAQQAHKTEVET